MYNKIISWLLIFCMALHCGAKVGVIAYFYTNQSYIAEFLCMNKAKPALHCEGKCFLSKKLNKTDEQNNKLPSSIKTAVETVYLYETLLINLLSPVTFLSKSANSFFLVNHFKSPDISIELPPKIELVTFQ